MTTTTEQTTDKPKEKPSFYIFDSAPLLPSQKGEHIMPNWTAN
jgi:hypothetical protein